MPEVYLGDCVFMGKNVLLAQSGGPTAVINSSIAGAFYAANESDDIDNVYAAIGGIQGVMSERFVNLSELPDENMKMFRYTPSAGLNSCRHVLSDDENNEEYRKIFEVFEKYDIGFFFYNGGNDSMDTANKLNKYAVKHGYDVKINGIPKTIDNDLFGTDHCPGFGSAAKYLKVTLQEAAYDTYSYPNSKTVIIMETMGRNTGWLAGSTALAEYKGRQIADFIYTPEAAFDMDKFLSSISNALDKQTMVFAVVSEGIKNKDGKPLFSAEKSTHDKFGHQQLGGMASFLAGEFKKNVIKRVKTVNPDIAQRCAAHMMSAVDFDEAYKAGYMSVKFALDGISGVMSAFERVSNDPYSINIIPAPLSAAANTEKKIPADWILPEGDNVTEQFKKYVRPLIMGQVDIPFKNGLPDYFVL